MSLPVVPQAVYDLEENTKKLRSERIALETPTVMGGYTLDKVPQASYKLTGGTAKSVEAWDDYDWQPGGEIGGVPSVGYGEDPYEASGGSYIEGGYSPPAERKLKEGYRMGESGKVQRKRTYDEYVPYEWKLDDPHAEVRGQLTEAENVRVAKLTDTRNKLAEDESKLLAYNRTIRGYSGDAASRPGTRRKTILGGRPSLG